MNTSSSPALSRPTFLSNTGKCRTMKRYSPKSSIFGRWLRDATSSYASGWKTKCSSSQARSTGVGRSMLIQRRPSCSTISTCGSGGAAVAGAPLERVERRRRGRGRLGIASEGVVLHREHHHTDSTWAAGYLATGRAKYVRVYGLHGLGTTHEGVPGGCSVCAYAAVPSR